MGSAKVIVMSERLERLVEQVLSDTRDLRQEMRERFDRVEQRLEGLEGRMERVEQRLDGVEQRLDGVEQRLDSVEQRLGRMDRTLDLVKAATLETASKVKDHEGRITALEAAE